MDLKYMLAAGVILFSCTASAQTAAGNRAYNGGGLSWGEHYPSYTSYTFRDSPSLVQYEMSLKGRGVSNMK